jgi:hypothetical protein
MPLDPEELPPDLRELAPAIVQRGPRAGSRESFPKGKHEKWAEYLFDPNSPLLTAELRARLQTLFGAESVHVRSESDRSLFHNDQLAKEQLLQLLAPFRTSGQWAPFLIAASDAKGLLLLLRVRRLERHHGANHGSRLVD